MDAEAARREALRFAKERKGKEGFSNPTILILDLLCGPLRERPERAPLASLCVKAFKPKG